MNFMITNYIISEGIHGNIFDKKSAFLKKLTSIFVKMIRLKQVRFWLIFLNKKIGI